MWAWEEAIPLIPYPNDPVPCLYYHVAFPEHTFSYVLYHSVKVCVLFSTCMSTSATLLFITKSQLIHHGYSFVFHRPVCSCSLMVNSIGVKLRDAKHVSSYRDVQHSVHVQPTVQLSPSPPSPAANSNSWPHWQQQPSHPLMSPKTLPLPQPLHTLLPVFHPHSLPFSCQSP